MIAADAVAPTQRLEGTLERVSYYSQETGYTVARLRVEGTDDLVTVVARMALPSSGASLRLEGRWTNHPRYGQQFEVSEYAERLPATIEGIRRYLGSGMIPGIGPVMAERIVETFGTETLDVIESSPDRLAEVPGVGRKRIGQIERAWREQSRVRDLMLFLQSHSVSTGLAVRIYRQYGDEAAGVVRDDPYRLARDIYGVGFTTADRIARRLGLPADSPRRAEAGVVDTLQRLVEAGHVFARRSSLIAEAARRLAAVGPGEMDEPRTVIEGPGPTASQIEAAVDALVGIGDLRADASIGGDPSDPAVYPPGLHAAEVAVADRLGALLDTDVTRLGSFRAVHWAAALDWLDRQLPFPLAGGQREAVRMALTHQVTVVTGGPGTGKTTTVRAILLLLRARNASIQLAAPTGRAAKRLAEATGIEARTIHRLLEFKPAEGWQFLRDEKRPLDADLVVIDEMSMVDLPLMNALVRAVAPGTHLVMIGDVNQLPSVGPGNVLHDVIASGAVPTVALEQVFRQDPRSFIVVNAHRINAGQMPLFEKDSKDFFMFRAEDASTAAEWILDVACRRIPERFGFHPLDDVQVLSPMHRGRSGVSALNALLQEALNPPASGKAEMVLGNRTLRVGDKVMQIRNDYRKGVFNGDLGRLTAVDVRERRLEATFDGLVVPYDHYEADELVHAFACSTHKSQGAEYPAVVLAILPEHYMLLQRNLLYTAVTRARKLCVLVGSMRAIGRAVHNDEVTARNSGLAARLAGAAGRVS